jgi:hypothetical protein
MPATFTSYFEDIEPSDWAGAGKLFGEEAEKL